jgi:hypothetical protein
MPYTLDKRQKITKTSPIFRRKHIPEGAVYFETIASSYTDPGEDWCEIVFFDEDMKEISRKRITGY